MDGYQDGYDWIKHCFVCDGYYTYDARCWSSLHANACRSDEELAEEAARNLAAHARAERIQYVQDGYVLLMPPQTH